MPNLNQFCDDLSLKIDGVLSGNYKEKDSNVEYLSVPAGNIIEWVTGTEYWNVSTTFDHSRQYQILRDTFNCRCKICNSVKQEAIDCWGKSRIYLESETLLTWNNIYMDFVCPKCGTTMSEFVNDGMITPYNDVIIIAGMRSGKSYLGAHIGGYVEHMSICFGMKGRGYLQRFLRQERSEWFEVTFAASTAAQAEQTIYAKYREMRNNSPWINRYMDWVTKEEKKQPISKKNKWEYKLNDDMVEDGYLQIRFNRVSSESSGVAGRTRIMASLDEWSRLSETEGTRSAKELFRVLNQSLRTVRTEVDVHNLPSFFGMMVNVTSPISNDDSAMVYYNRAMEGTLKRTYAWKGSTWNFNPFQPREALQDEYDKDPIGFERDFGANPPDAAVQFVNDPIRFWKSIDWGMKPKVRFQHIYLSDPTNEKYIGIKVDDCKLDVIHNHYIFCDAGVTFDSFSIVCAHPEWINVDDAVKNESDEDFNFSSDDSARIRPMMDGMVSISELGGQHISEFGGMVLNKNVGGDNLIKNLMDETHRVEGYNRSTVVSGQPYEHMGEMLVTVYDFCIRIVPTHERDIWFESVVDVIKELKKNIKIAAVCFDYWNSESSIQQIRSMGIQSYKVNLKIDDFMSFLRLSYNGRVKMLPPNKSDKINMNERGNLIIGNNQEDMEGESTALVELLKLNRSPDLKKIYNPNKGKIRGRDSDDMARCIIGSHFLVQNSIVDELANVKKKKNIRKKLIAGDSPLLGMVHKGSRGF